MTPMYADRGHDAAVPCALVGYSARMTPVPESMLRKQSQFLVGGVAGARPSRADCGRRSGRRRGASWLTCAVLFCFLVVIGCSKQETAPPSPSADAPIVQPARAPAEAAPKADAPGTAAELPEGEHPPDDEVAAEAVVADDKPTASEDGSGLGVAAALLRRFSLVGACVQADRWPPKVHDLSPERLARPLTGHHTGKPNDPSAVRRGANEFLRFGGTTSGGLLEVVLGQVPAGSFRSGLATLKQERPND